MIETKSQLLEAIRTRNVPKAVAVPFFTSAFVASYFDHEWVGECDDEEVLDGSVEIGKRFGFVPIIEIGWWVLDFFPWEKRVLSSSESGYVEKRYIKTPDGEFSEVFDFRKSQGDSIVEHAVKNAEDIQKYRFVVNGIRQQTDQARQKLINILKRVGQGGLIYLNFPLPHSCFGFLTAEDFIYFQYDNPEMAQAVCRENFETSKAMIMTGIESGVDLFFTTTHGLGLYSPDILQKYAIPYAVEIAKLIHEQGKLLYIHDCGRMHDLIVDGTYNRIHPDLLIGFEKKPSGDIVDFGEARKLLDKEIVTQGNISMDLLRRGSGKDIMKAREKILIETQGFPHIISGSCAMLPGTPDENISAMIGTDT